MLVSGRGIVICTAAYPAAKRRAIHGMNMESTGQSRMNYA